MRKVGLSSKIQLLSVVDALLKDDNFNIRLHVQNIKRNICMHNTVWNEWHMTQINQTNLGKFIAINAPVVYMVRSDFDAGNIHNEGR